VLSQDDRDWVRAEAKRIFAGQRRGALPFRPPINLTCRCGRFSSSTNPCLCYRQKMSRPVAKAAQVAINRDDPNAG